MKSLTVLTGRLLWRNLRSGEIKILALALVLAVVVVTAINVFAERLEKSLINNSRSFLAADRLISSSQLIDLTWQEKADSLTVDQAFTARFSSIIYSEQENLLAAIKAVSQGYPLVGDVLVSDHAFASDASLWTSAKGPASGEAWVDSRVLSLLSIELGDRVSLGESSFLVSKVIIREPDRGSGFSLFAPRVMINYSDLAATDIVQPGSRIKYGWLLKGGESQLNQLFDWLTPKLLDHHQIKTIDNGQLGLKRNLDKAQSFMRLASLIGVLLAGIAIAINAQVFARKHTEPIALMKSLGMTTGKLRRLYLGQLILLGLCASIIGLLIGSLLEQGIVSILDRLLDIELASVGLLPYGLSLLTGLLCLLGFALPALWHLPAVAPIRVLRQDLPVRGLSQWFAGTISAATLLILALIYSRSIFSSAIFGLSLIVIIVLSVIVTRIILALTTSIVSRLPLSQTSTSLRLALSNIDRHRSRSLTQIVIFAGIGLLLLVMVVMRTQLLTQWQMSLPENAPNHFLVNIANDELAPLKKELAASGISSNTFYPITRARLIEINHQQPSQSLREKVEVLAREANLSVAGNLPDGNKLTKGRWWLPVNESSPQTIEVSVESEIAQEMALVLGDSLAFSVGGLRLEATVTSFREVSWDSLNPNFYFLFSPKGLDQFVPSYLTSLYVEDKPGLYKTLRQYPTVVVIDTDAILATIRDIINQVTRAVELILWIILIAGFFVMLSAINASMAERWQAAALMRTVGASKKQLFLSIGAEFMVLGLIAGLLAVVGAMLIVGLLQYFVFSMSVNFDSALYVLTPVLLAGVIVGFGLWICRRVITVAPMEVLRDG